MSQSEKRPFFSIVIPVWNRADVIKRCLDSIFEQDFDDFEIVAVDDGSTDDSVVVMEEYEDPRLKIIRQPENRGVCAARHVGTAAAKGKWIVNVDSDDAMLSGALIFLAEMACHAPPDVGVIAGSAIRDDGTVTPDPIFPEGPFGYVEWLKYYNDSRHMDYQPCRRREVFDTVSWPTDRRLESQCHFHVFKS